MNLNEYIIRYNSHFGQEEKYMIDLKNVDLSESEFVGKLMDCYVLMLKEKLSRKKIARSNEAFEMSGMSEEERYMFDSLAGTYIYENQFHRKQLQEDIAELSGLTMKQVEELALLTIGEIEELSQEEKANIAKLLSTKDEELEPKA